MSALPRPLVSSMLLLAACNPNSFPRAHLATVDAQIADQDTGAGILADAGDLDADEMDDGASQLDSNAADDIDADTEAATIAAPDTWSSPCDPALTTRPFVATDNTATEVLRFAHTGDVDVEVLGPVVTLSARRLWTFSATRLKSGVAQPSGAAFNYPNAAFQALDAGPPAAPAWGLDRRLTELGEPGTVVALLAGESSNTTTLRPVAIVSGSRDQGPEAWALVVSQAFGASAYDGWMAVATDSEPPIVRQGVPVFGQMYGDYYIPMAAWHADDAAVEGDYVYLFACSADAQDSGFRVPCIVVRAAAALADQRSAYTGYVIDTNGQGAWGSDLSKATPVFNGSTAMLSVSFNAFLGQFVAVYGDLFSDDVVIQTAPQPEGPWTRAATVNLPASATPGAHAAFAREQPALSPNCGQRMVLSYVDPSRSENGFPAVGDTVLATVLLQ